MVEITPEQIFVAVVLLIVLRYAWPTENSSKKTMSTLNGASLLHYLIPGTEMNGILWNTRDTTNMIFKLHARYGEIFRMPLGLYTSVATADPDDVTFIISNTSTVAKTRGIQFTMEEAAPGNLFTLSEDEHRILRKHFQNTFNSSLLPNFHHIISDAVIEGAAVLKALSEVRGHSLDSMSQHERVVHDSFTRNGFIDLTRVLSTITLKAITAVCFGTSLSIAQREAFLSSVEVLSSEMLHDTIFDPVRRMAFHIPYVGKRFFRTRFSEAKQLIRHYCKAFMDDRIKEWNNPNIPKPTETRDLMDAILKKNSDDIEFIITHTMTFALAGSLSTNQAIAWALFELCKPENREAYECTQKEVDLVCKGLSSDECMGFENVGLLQFTRAVWKETLRLHPPGFGYARTAVSDLTLPGSKVHVCAGTPMLALTHLLQCDERYFKNAFAFEPTRWIESDQSSSGNQRPICSYVPFGMSAHSCAGQFFAEHEGMLVLAEMMRRFELHLDCDASEILSCSGFVETAKFSSKRDGVFDMGVPIIATPRF